MTMAVGSGIHLSIISVWLPWIVLQYKNILTQIGEFFIPCNMYIDKNLVSLVLFEPYLFCLIYHDGIL